MTSTHNGTANGTRHFLDLKDFSSAQLRGMLDASAAMKRGRRKGVPATERPLAGKFLGMVFDRPSTRTRVSFDVAMRELGGETLMLTGSEMQLGRGETVGDTARVLSRYVDAIMIRILDHDLMLELAEHAEVPVINALTKVSHPCQIMADVLTFEEHRGSIRGRTVAWSGDANNVLASWAHAAARFDFTLNIAAPPQLAAPPSLLAWAKEEGARINVTTDPYEAVDGADAVVTDCWVSMGDEDEGHRHNLLSPYRVDAKLMAAAKGDALFMHCLPAHRGEEVTAEVMDGPQSVVFDEAENRLHAQKGILAWCLGAEGA
ncbi:ornithine carbamoyltransferase [Methylobacterium iners]|uniref:Ornithine carbamoyltransferase n=1 Tax=Methylobacterium iners TaxID=418707 RepID=A0ABQ4RU57_9HYPH|nr:ornithine carbamoyltransferase [Methylobacterium iners]GJD94336.1 Ornithine carbamoyltransferase, anabolic [Methylobacterium iners]